MPVSMPPRNFARAYDLSSLGKPPVANSEDYGFVITQKNLMAELLPTSHKKIIIVVCWSPRSPQSSSLIDLLRPLVAQNESTCLLATLNVDDEPQVAQAMQVQAIPLTLAIIQEQIVPLFESSPPADQIAMVLKKVIDLAAERGLVTGQPVDDSPAENSIVTQTEPEEEEALAALENNDLEGAKAAYSKWITRKPQEQMAKLGLAQVELLIRIKGLEIPNILAQAAASPNNLGLQIQASDIEFAQGEHAQAFGRLIRAVKIFEGDERKSAREHLLLLFTLVDPSDPILIKARSELASALF
jgi:putative thioredoxin